MSKFFVPSLGNEVVIEGELFRHMAKSLRMKEGDSCKLCDGKRHEAEGVISSVGASSLTVSLNEIKDSEAEPKTSVALYAAWPKGDKGELIVQKAVEIGAVAVIFVMTEFCVSKPKASDYEKKIARLNKIALEAATQCGRGIIPEVRGIIGFEEALEEMQTYEKHLMLYEGSCPPMRGIIGDEKSYALMTGPEGGFSKEEVSKASQMGIEAVSLGKRILRCETAPLTALSALLFYKGDMD